jgi:hypothetical protein
MSDSRLLTLGIERIDRSMPAQDEISGETLAAISREMVRLKAEYYGRGASDAKSYVCDDWLFFACSREA